MDEKTAKNTTEDLKLVSPEGDVNTTENLKLVSPEGDVKTRLVNNNQLPLKNIPVEMVQESKKDFY